MERLGLFVIPVGIFIFYYSYFLPRSGSIVYTENGPIQGNTVASGKVVAYLGIPYAEPPVGQLRFAKPVPKAPWKDLYNATQLPPPCIQKESRLPPLSPDLPPMSEDCLYLNVWTPNSKDNTDLKAVMFFIHGGAFLEGTSSLKVYDGTILAEQGDVVVVTINYRLGSLGFFYGGTDDAPGNQAFHDQILALRWVKDNARHFGGDPDNIVIFGESAGAFSVSLLQISPSSRNLFKRVILQSGSAVNPLYSVGNKAFAKINSMFAEELRCTTDPETGQDPATVLECMRKKPAEAFSKADMSVCNSGTSVLLPRFGDELFPEGAVSLFRGGHFKDSEVLMGITRDEGSLFVYFDKDLFKRLAHIEKDPFNRTTAKEAIKRNSWTRLLLNLKTAKDGESILHSYLDDVNDESEYTYLSAMIDITGDSHISCGNVFQAEYQSSRGSPVYFYRFDHRAMNSPFPKWMGVPHIEEIAFVFGNPLVGQFTKEDAELSINVIDMWTSFAKTGKPSIPGGLEWPRYTAEEPRYYVIGEKDRVGTRPDKHRCERWRNIFLQSGQSSSKSGKKN